MKSKILIVDDILENRTLLQEQIAALGHTTILAENGLSGLTKIKTMAPDLVLLDILMPEMNGYEVLEQMKDDSKLHHIPVIMITAVDDIDSVVECIEKGADDYLTKPFNSTLLKARINGSLEKKRLQDEEFDSVNKETIFALATLTEWRDPETGEHLLRMREYCKILSEQLRLLSKYTSQINEKFVHNIYFAAPLHDIGKVGIPDKILQKPGKLTKEEFNIMKAHSVIGADTLKEVHNKYTDNSFLSVGIEIAECHHEKWDGSGYPYGLAGANIPLVARILALGDVYDALTSRRCYKEALSHTRSKEIIIEGNGIHFDPDVFDAFLATEKEFITVRKHITDTEKKLTL